MYRVEYESGKFFVLEDDRWLHVENGEQIRLSKKHCALLRCLLERSNRRCSREILAKEVWHEEDSVSYEVDWDLWKNKMWTELSRIRKQLDSVGIDGKKLIENADEDSWIIHCISCEDEESYKNAKQRKLSQEYTLIEPTSGEYYCERTFLVEKIQNALAKKRVVFISGLSGLGKTELAYHYGSIGGYKNIIPIALQSNGKGSFADLCSQVNIEGGTELSDVASVLRGLNKDSLVIIDNYNDAFNGTVYEALRKIPHAHIIVTSQLQTDEMDEHGSVVLIDDAEENVSDKEKFAIRLFCTYAKLNDSKLSQKDLDYLKDIVKAVQYHTMIVCMLGRQYKKNNRSFQNLRNLIVENVEEALRTNIKVSIIKDKERYTQTPYELLKVLFKNQILSRNFTAMERQVLGALIFSEKYSNDLEMICISVGDLEELNCVSARDAVNSLQEDGIVAIQGSKLHIHPLMRALVCDEGLGLTNYPMIAELEYEFLLHLMKNKQIEKYTYAEENIERDTQVRNMTPWHKWVFDFIEKNVIPYTCSRDKEFEQYYNNEDYLLVSCHGTSGNSIYIRFNSGKEFCLINGSGQRIKEYRYYNPNGEEKEFPYTKCNLLHAKYGEVDKIVLPETVAGAPVLSIGRRLLYNHKMKHVVIPSEVQWIGDYAFCDCTELEEIVIPDKVGIIGSRAFTNCISATKLQLGKSVRSIYMAAFSRCKNIQGKIEFPDTLSLIFRYAFCQCSSIEEVVFSDIGKVKELGAFAFSNCTRLKKLHLGKKMDCVSGDVFADCYSLEEVTIPGTLKEISTNLFSNCRNLKTVVVKRGVKKINNHAFGDCIELQTVRLPKSITGLVGAPFGGCPKVNLEVYEDSLAYKILLQANAERGRKIKYTVIKDRVKK